MSIQIINNNPNEYLVFYLSASVCILLIEPAMVYYNLVSIPITCLLVVEFCIVHYLTMYENRVTVLSAANASLWLGSKILSYTPRVMFQCHSVYGTWVYWYCRQPFRRDSTQLCSASTIWRKHPCTVSSGTEETMSSTVILQQIHLLTRYFHSMEFMLT